MAKLYSEGRAKIKPIIFSHGLISNRNYYNSMGQEFASNGYIVFLIDHLDGSNIYTLKKDQTVHTVPFDESPHPDIAFKMQTENTESAKKFWYQKLEIRTTEVSALIDDIHEKEFLGKVIGFNSGLNAKIDLENLIISGHSMGGATALNAGDTDKRIKAVLTHDPWGKLLGSKIGNFTDLMKKPIQMTNTSQFAI